MEEKREEEKKKGTPHSPAGAKHVAIVHGDTQQIECLRKLPQI